MTWLVCEKNNVNRLKETAVKHQGRSGRHVCTWIFSRWFKPGSLAHSHTLLIPTPLRCRTSLGMSLCCACCACGGAPRVQTVTDICWKAQYLIYSSWGKNVGTQWQTTPTDPPWHPYRDIYTHIHTYSQIERTKERENTHTYIHTWVNILHPSKLTQTLT